MKRIFTLVISALTLLTAAAQPLLVGHRGSNYGVENSVESFENGVKLGYKYLETDVKFTKDNILVCSHDDDTKRLGGTKTLAGSTLAELQSETLTQTRLGTTYTGRLCSMREYLQICKNAGIGALIELKWTAGMNSNDCSKIPLLIDQIDQEGMRANCIIMTSMKPCLEYIRTHYPEIELQFLGRESWPEHFDWCAKWKIDADLEAPYFNADDVRRFHEQGLKVNMWTTNDDAGYKKYAEMGCDFITTDRIDGHDLPEITPAPAVDGNMTDYPETTFTPTLSDSYQLSEAEKTAWPAEFDGITVRRALRAAAGWYVLGFDGSDYPRLYYWHDGKAPVAMDTDDTEDLSDIALTTDGVLLGSLKAPAANWKLYTWTGIDEYAEEIGNLDDFYDFMDTEVGASMTVSGRFGDLIIYLSANDEPGMCVIDFNGINATAASCHPFADAFGSQAAEGSLKLSPAGRHNVVLFSDGVAKDYYIDNETLTEATADVAVPAGVSDFQWFRYGGRVYQAAVSAFDSGMLSACVYDADGKPVTLSHSLCPESDAYVAVDVRTVAMNDTPVRVFIEGQGVFTLKFDAEGSGVSDIAISAQDDFQIVTDLYGRPIADLDNAPRGVYIVRRAGSSEKILR